MLEVAKLQRRMAEGGVDGGELRQHGSVRAIHCVLREEGLRQRFEATCKFSPEVLLEGTQKFSQEVVLEGTWKIS